MSGKAICILCEKNAERSHIQGKDGYLVECEICGKYFLGSPVLFEGAYKILPREKRRMISAYTRELFEKGENPPEFGDPDELKKVINVYENKTQEEKLNNLVLFLMKKSSQFDDLVSWEPEKDFPIIYSLSSQQFSELINEITKRNFLTKESGNSGKLTEKGWNFGKELKKNLKS